MFRDGMMFNTIPVYINIQLTIIVSQIFGNSLL